MKYVRSADDGSDVVMRTHVHSRPDDRSDVVMATTTRVIYWRQDQISSSLSSSGLGFLVAFLTLEVRSPYPRLKKMSRVRKSRFSKLKHTFEESKSWECSDSKCMRSDMWCLFDIAWCCFSNTPEKTVMLKTHSKIWGCMCEWLLVKQRQLIGYLNGLNVFTLL